MRSRRFRHLAVPLIALLAVTAVAVVLVGHLTGGLGGDKRTSEHGMTGLPAATDAQRKALSDSIRPVPATPAGKLRFGLGPGLDSAQSSPLAGDLDFYSTWFNGPNDLGFLRKWKLDLIPQVYRSGHGVHLIVWLDGTGSTGTFSTAHGQACGREYPLSSAFLSDARELASIFAGAANGPALYVTLFTEFQTYPCQTNAWAASAETTNYYLTLKDQYLAAMQIFHAGAPNARVSLGWGGWQERWDDPLIGGGKSLLPYFADVMRASDFQSFQAMGGDPSAPDVQSMTAALGRFGPVMLAHYKSESQSAWQSDMQALLTGDEVRQLSAAGLFAFSFMDQDNIGSSPAALALARGALQSHGIRSPL